jgi:Flp pilus assembly protein TadG
MHEGARSLFQTGRELPQALRRLARQEGQALVEFALILPALMFILLGILDFGRAMNYYNDLTQLAAEGARAAAVNHNPDGTLVVAATPQSIQQQLKAQPDTKEIINNSTFKVCLTAPAAGIAGVGNPVTVTTTMDFKLLPYIGGTIKLSGKSTMRAEAPVVYQSGCV